MEYTFKIFLKEATRWFQRVRPDRKFFRTCKSVSVNELRSFKRSEQTPCSNASSAFGFQLIWKICKEGYFKSIRTNRGRRVGSFLTNDGKIQRVRKTRVRNVMFHVRAERSQELRNSQAQTRSVCDSGDSEPKFDHNGFR